MKIVHRISIVLFFLMFSNSVSSTIIGADGRIKLTTEEKEIPEFRQTGIVNIGGEGFGSGIVTGANCDVVLTAAHLIRYNQEDARYFNRRIGELRESWRLNFVPDPSRAIIGYQASLVISGFDDIENIRLLGSNEIAHQHDWSVLQLSRPAMRQCVQIKYIRDKTTCAGPIRIPAVHIDAYDDVFINDIHADPCFIHPTKQKNLILHDCDTKDGASGAPLFCEVDSDLYFIGINAGFAVPDSNYEEPDKGMPGVPFNSQNHVNFAVPLHKDFANALEDALKQSEQRRMLKNRW